MRLIHYIIFTIFFIVQAFLFDYHHTTFYKPQSTHTWRQSDCASFSLNYYQYNRFISHPRLHNRKEGDGYMVGEFPILYYVSAQLYRVFGVHEFIPRFLNVLILFIGLMSLFKLTFDITQSLFFAYIMPLLLFCAPVITFYGNNFLTDVPAFAFTIMGWSLLWTHFRRHRLVHLYGAGACFAVAGLLKITMLMSVVAFGGVFLLEWFGWSRFSLSLQAANSAQNQQQNQQNSKDQQLYQYTWHTIGVFAAVLLVVGAWYYFSIRYNAEHGVEYFLSGTMAAWENDRMDWFTYTIYRIFYFWSGYYYFTLTHYLIIFLGFVVFFGRKAVHSLLFTLSALTFAGAFSLVQLFYYQFSDHDYYVIPGYAFVIFVLLTGIILLRQHYTHVFQSWILKIVVVLFLGLNIWHAKSTIHERYNGKLSYKPNVHLYEDDFEKYIDNLGVQRTDLVVSVPDYSPNTTLYLMNRPGFTEWIDRKGTKINQDWMRDFIKRGAKYLIVHDDNYLQREYLQPFLQYEMGNYKGIKVYDLSSLNN